MRKFRYLIILGIFILDQGVKYLVRSNMYVGETISIIPNVFNLTYVQNRGAAFSLFWEKNIFLTVVPFIALFVAIWYLERHRKEHICLIVSLQLVIAGGFGNLIDRLILGYVTDMFDFLIWPVFNIADISICIGCGLLVLYIFIFDKPNNNLKENKG